jgi:hypothetical protein
MVKSLFYRRKVYIYNKRSLKFRKPDLQKGFYMISIFNEVNFRINCITIIGSVLYDSSCIALYQKPLYFSSIYIRMLYQHN